MYLVKTEITREDRTFDDRLTRVKAMPSLPERHPRYGIRQRDNGGDTRNAIREVTYYDADDSHAYTTIKVADDEWWNSHDLM